MDKAHTLLVVEDDETLRYAFVSAFERAGYRVDAASHGGEALRFLSESAGSYCAVVLDMIVPTVHGSSIIAHIARTTPRLPVVSVTGYPDRVLFADPSDRHVVKAVFVKPVEPNDVAAFLKSRCSRES